MAGRPPNVKFRRLDLFANPADDRLDAFPLRVGDDDKEFVATDAAANIALPRIRLQDLRKRLENAVAGFVPVCIVDGFEIVQVGHDDPERKGVAHRAAQFARGPLFDSPAVGQFGESVGECELLELPILGLDLELKPGDLPADGDARCELLGMKRLGEVFVGTGLQASHDLGFIGDAGEQDDVGEAIRKPAAEALAQLDAAQIGHQPVGDHQSRATLFEYLQGFLARLHGEDLIFVWRESVLNELSRDR